jgi:4'-phosphopantetheinyl transferase EntD
MATIFPEFEALAATFEGSAVVAVIPEDIDGGIFGDELEAVVGVAPRRRTQFIAGRTSARWALHRLGQPTTMIPRTESGAPQWPPGIVGSIAHCDGCAVAVAAPASQWLGFGIDVEPAAPLPEDAAAIALTRAERHALEQLPGGYARWSRALFCAKECVHKLLNPLTGAWLEFDDMVITLDPQRSTFDPQPLTGPAQQACKGLRLQGGLAFSGGFLTALLSATADRGAPNPPAV